MFVHIFGFRWNPAATEEQKAQAREEIFAFRNVIPGLREVHAGVNVSERARGYELAGLMLFESRKEFEAYTTHPAHLALLKWLVPLIEPVELDFEA